MKDSQKALLLVIGFFVIANLFWFYSDDFGAWAQSADAFSAIALTIALSPAYLLIIYGFWKKYQVKGVIGSIFLIIAVDLISLTHTVHTNGLVPMDSALYPYTDSVLWQHFANAFPFGTWGMYVLLTTLLFIAALELFGYKTITRLLKRAV